MSLTKPTFWEKAKLCWYELLSWCHLLSVVLFASACGCGTCYAEAGSATAQEVALRGGMSLIDGTFITACLMGIAAIISACGGVIWANKRNEKKAQRPLDTDDTFVTHGECKAHRCAIEKRIETIGPTLERIFKKLTEIDRKDEDRINSVHRRVDPLIEKLAANSAKIEMIEKRSVSGASD